MRNSILNAQGCETCVPPMEGHPLPPEILSHVIRYYIPDEDARDASSIIPMTHVCRYWRESIISTPGIWTRISNQRIDLAKLSLERCKAAPLKLWLDVRDGRVTPGFSDLLIPCIQNTKALVVESSLTEKEIQTFQNFLPPMPNLRSLSLSAEGARYWDWSNDPYGQLTSSLTYLFLSGVPLYSSCFAIISSTFTWTPSWTS